ncbi:MAG: hypothetical protein AAF202_05090 [Pseudomonadota bacterium]
MSQFKSFLSVFFLFCCLVSSSVLLFLPTIFNESVFYYADSGFYLLHNPAKLVDSALLWRPIVYNWFLRLPVLAVAEVANWSLELGLEGAASFLRSLASVKFAIFVQCCVTNLSLYLCGRALFQGYRFWQHLIVLCVLSVVTPIALYANFVMTDIYAGLLVLCWIAADRSKRLSKIVSWIGVGLGFAVVHFSHLLATYGAVTIRALRHSAWKTVLWAVILFQVSFLIIGTINYFGKGRFQISNTAGIYLFSKLYSLEIAQSYLNEECAKPSTFKICAAYQRDPDFHIWGLQEGFVQELGGMAFVKQELTQISIEILTSYRFFIYVYKSMVSVLKQWVWIQFPLKPEIENLYLEKELSFVSKTALTEFRNQKLRWAVDRGYLANTGEAMAIVFGLCLIFVIVSWRTSQPWMTEEWKNTYRIAGAHYLSNGLVVGLLTDPESRYSNRLIWLLVFLVLLHFIAKLPEIRESWLDDNEQRLD